MINWQGKTTAILWISILVFAFISKCSHGSKPAEIVKSDSSYYWKNKYGDVVVSQKKTADEFAIVNTKLRDSLAKAFNTKPQSIKEYIVVHEEAKSDVPAITDTKAADYFPPHDSCPPQVKNLRQTFASNYYHADVQIGDSSYLHLSAKDTIAIVWHTTKTGSIFHRKEYLQADISNANPDVKISGLQMYRVAEKKPKRIGIGMQGGYGFSNGSSPQPYVGIGISYNLIRL